MTYKRKQPSYLILLQLYLHQWCRKYIAHHTSPQPPDGRCGRSWRWWWGLMTPTAHSTWLLSCRGCSTGVSCHPANRSGSSGHPWNQKSWCQWPQYSNFLPSLFLAIVCYHCWLKNNTLIKTMATGVHALYWREVLFTDMALAMPCTMPCTLTRPWWCLVHWHGPGDALYIATGVHALYCTLTQREVLFTDMALAMPCTLTRPWWCLVHWHGPGDALYTDTALVMSCTLTWPWRCFVHWHGPGDVLYTDMAPAMSCTLTWPWQCLFSPVGGLWGKVHWIQPLLPEIEPVTFQSPVWHSTTKPYTALWT